MKLQNVLYILFGGLAIASLLLLPGRETDADTAERKDELAEIVADYIATYQAREDWNHFLSFYSDSLQFLDINLRVAFADKSGFASFYDWPNPDFEKQDPTQDNFTLEEVAIDTRSAVIKGRFQPFYWKGKRQEWTDLFTIWLHFNEDLKIIRQHDFIRYPKAFLPD